MPGAIRAKTLSELLTLDFGGGERIPTFDEVLGAFPGVALNVEIKQADPAIEEHVFAVLDAQGARDRVLLAAADATVMERIRAHAPEQTTGSSSVEVFEFVTAVREGRAPAKPRGFALQVPPEFGGVTVVDRALVDAAHAVGVEVHVWTINDPREIERLLALGVDGIMSDYPDRAAAVMGIRSGSR